MKIRKEIGKNPYIDWIIILFLSIMTILALAIVGAYLYNAVTKGDIKADSSSGIDSASAFKRNDLSKVIDYYSKKDQAREDAKAGYKGFKDPQPL